MKAPESPAVDDNLSENRLDRRYRLAIPLTCSHFSSTYKPSFEAIACNTSQRGLCFRSAAPLMKGQYIWVRPGSSESESSSVDRTPVSVRALAMAQVRWCLVEILDTSPVYTVGIEYL